MFLKKEKVVKKVLLVLSSVVIGFGLQAGWPYTSSGSSSSYRSGYVHPSHGFGYTGGHTTGYQPRQRVSQVDFDRGVEKQAYKIAKARQGLSYSNLVIRPTSQDYASAKAQLLTRYEPVSSYSMTSGLRRAPQSVTSGW